jgi:putative RNA 2'-phosphotransferase
MEQQRRVKISKFLSLVLRHQPQKIGLRPDAAGWVQVSDLLAACNAHGQSLSLDELREVVNTNDKQRFSFSPDGLLIRANQGHSIPVELGYEPLAPPTILYHGTPEKFLTAIKETGLTKGQRHHVHLSADVETATRVGARRGRPVVLEIRAATMHGDGYIFYLSENGVWLTEHVPVKYLRFPEADISLASARR